MQGRHVKTRCCEPPALGAGQRPGAACAIAAGIEAPGPRKLVSECGLGVFFRLLDRPRRGLPVNLRTYRLPRHRSRTRHLCGVPYQRFEFGDPRRARPRMGRCGAE